MNSRIGRAIILSAVALGMTGCTGTISGNAVPAALDGPRPAPGGAPPGTTDPATKLASIDPCALLVQNELDRLGLSKENSETRLGARRCIWGRGSQNGHDGYVISAGIRDHQGLKDINKDGYTVTDDPIGRHSAQQAEEVGDGSGCFVAVGVTDSTRVDITASTDAGKACALANTVAKVVEPLLPGGNG